MRILVKTRTDNGQVRYLCPICEWVNGRVVEVTGYPELVCEHCGTTLVEDIFDHQAIENEES